ncbi:S8 family peptidase [Rossellomorea sp. YZS02]|uniref:S8 family peptidase n=1 Tax=Rossellomorea sp. YZS02 TaxID=3097358 RepID=UPI002A14F59E|nr:S8 family peptidase [Rossellomorea sp. YZS02]MDX8346332.1 S8 family peptidase [Rossellomorea sp. YZS02]
MVFIFAYHYVPLSSAPSFNQELNEDLQWITKQEGPIVPWGVKSIKGEEENGEKYKQKVKVAILDSGIDKDHEDLKSKIKKEYNAINPGEAVVDHFGHGTAVAGVIAANPNDKGIVGLSPSVEIFSVKVLSDQGKGNVKALSRGIEWSIKQKVDIINISLGMPKDKAELKASINEALEAGIIVVASAGNNYGFQNDYPAQYDKVISVNALDANLEVSSLSSKGKIDYSAPGEDIVTTLNGNRYGTVKGTSIAAAFVTGTIAAILSNTEKYDLPNRNSPSYYSAIEKLLKKQSIKLGEKNRYGHGLIQL